MIELLAMDEYGQTFCAQTFTTVAAAEDALYRLESALEDCTCSARSFHIRELIAQLEDQLLQFMEAQ